MPATELKRSQLRDRNRAYVAKARDEMFCESCFKHNDDTTIYVYSRQRVGPSLSEMAYQLYSIAKLQAVMDSSLWLCRNCLNKFVEAKPNLGG